MISLPLTQHISISWVAEVSPDGCVDVVLRQSERSHHRAGHEPHLCAYCEQTDALTANWNCHHSLAVYYLGVLNGSVVGRLHIMKHTSRSIPVVLLRYISYMWQDRRRLKVVPYTGQRWQMFLKPSWYFEVPSSTSRILTSLLFQNMEVPLLLVVGSIILPRQAR